jgi:hypothetical protein
MLAPTQKLTLISRGANLSVLSMKRSFGGLLLSAKQMLRFVFGTPRSDRSKSNRPCVTAAFLFISRSFGVPHDLSAEEAARIVFPESVQWEAFRLAHPDHAQSRVYLLIGRNPSASSHGALSRKMLLCFGPTSFNSLPGIVP